MRLRLSQQKRDTSQTFPTHVPLRWAEISGPERRDAYNLNSPAIPWSANLLRDLSVTLVTRACDPSEKNSFNGTHTILFSIICYAQCIIERIIILVT